MIEREKIFTTKVAYRYFEKGEKVKYSDLARAFAAHEHVSFDKSLVFTVTDCHEPTSGRDSDAWVVVEELNYSIPSWDLVPLEKEAT